MIKASAHRLCHLGRHILVGCTALQRACPGRCRRDPGRLPGGSLAVRAGGEAIAVWERNLSTDLEARNIRLYYARYQNGAQRGAAQRQRRGAHRHPAAGSLRQRPPLPPGCATATDLTDGSPGASPCASWTAALPSRLQSCRWRGDRRGRPGHGRQCAPFLAFTWFEEPRRGAGQPAAAVDRGRDLHRPDDLHLASCTP